MTIALSPDQLAWIEARVAVGDYSDVDEAVRDLLAAGIAEHVGTGDDTAWAKPLVDEALAAIERGNTMTLDGFEAHLDEEFGEPPGRWRTSSSLRPRSPTSTKSCPTCCGPLAGPR